MDKKNILFVLPTLEAGGVTMVFLNLIEVLNKNKYKINLLLIKKTGEYIREIPSYVNVIELSKDEFITNYLLYGHKALRGMKNNYLHIIKHFNLMIIILLNFFTKKIFNRNISYQYISKIYARKLKGYDIAIDYYGLGSFTTFLVSKIKAKERISWIHNEVYVDDYALSKKEYECYDTVVGVSEECVRNFKKLFSSLADKCKVLHNINNVEKIRLMSLEKVDFIFNEFSIVSVGRLSKEKNFSFIIKVANILKDEVPDFCWYIIGDGVEKKELEKSIKINCLEKKVKLVGFDKNPYKYMREGALYAQTSKVEGFCTTISEAIILGKAIISTKFSGIDEQVKNGINGFFCMDEKEFADKIVYLYKNREVIEKMESMSLERDMSYVDETKSFFKSLFCKGANL